ncbi:hypothetical protein GU90_10505 [Saccharopolyspora rectivirgula]|uniref:Uncharacterized protein n=1 Tax=Saccharopolyspora rectivirgula TaxID=28042 RepID=A0A073AZX3_9PSEU|nr:hypothetical protein GU90_10505 [Saccharopolyspora rectivirgula]
MTRAVQPLLTCFAVVRVSSFVLSNAIDSGWASGTSPFTAAGTIRTPWPRGLSASPVDGLPPESVVRSSRFRSWVMSVWLLGGGFQPGKPACGAPPNPSSSSAVL